ncbi:MAG TPA: thioredoxin domain-containing protein [Fimbriimonas sp.]|nr:thioredoxin domain-containing protein [Fimbriimonas sp.]
MKKILISLSLAAVAAASVYAASIKWQPSFSTAVNLAKNSHKLVMVDFYTDWCGWCKKLDADTYTAPQITSRSEGFVPVKVNAEKEGKAEAAKYKVNGYPTILFLKPNGDLAWKVVGYMGPDDFAKQMDMAKNVLTEVPALEAKIKTNPNDVKSIAKILPYYGGMEALDKVGSVVSKLGRATGANAGLIADAYNAAGDAYQNSGDMVKAIPLFEKAIGSETPKQTAYARISIASCYLQSNEAKKAVPYLNALVKSGPEADSYRDEAQKMLKAIGNAP